MKRKYIIASIIGALIITGALLYLQLQRIKDYCIKVKKIKLKGLSIDNADIDLYLDFVNKSKLNLTIISQEYLVYINDKFVIKISNAIPQPIKANSSSEIGVKIQFSPKKIFDILKINAVSLASSPQTVQVKIETKMKIGYGILKFGVNYDYITNLKELLTSSEPNSSTNKC